jgi:hypothetical protein
MNEISTLRELRPAPPPAELEALQAAARQRFVAGTRSQPARARPRWRLPVLAGGLTAAAAAGAATALVLASGPAAVPSQQGTAGHAGTIVTAAWTVREDAAGTVTVYLRQYADPAGLQQTLRADDINAIVRPVPYTLGASNRKAYPACLYSTAGDAPLTVQYAVITGVKQDTGLQFSIHPTAMPPGSALFLPFMADVPDVSTGGTSTWALKPRVLNNDAVPGCVPFTMPARTAPDFAPKTG